MAQQIVNIGIAPNTNTGDPIRTAFTKINDNFTELYTFNLGQTAGSASQGFVNYSATTKTAGQFYGGTTAPDSVTRLNFDGYLYATRFYGDGSQLTGISALPTQTGQSGKYLTTDGTNASWSTVSLPSGQTAGSTTSGYLQYSGTTATAGQINGGTTTPTGTTRLNYEGYLYATRFYGDGSQLTNLSAGNLSGTIPSAVLGNSSFNIGTTSIALNRSSASQSLTGVSIDGNAGTVTNGIYSSGSYADPSWITSLDKSKVGLGNVENTALSTWAGSTNITTIGAATASSLSITGNLTVNGTTTTVNSTTVTIDDPILTLGGDTAPTIDDNKDRGIEFRWHNGTSAKAGFFGFDDSTGYLTFIPDATNTSEVFSGTQGDIQASNFRGALIGNASTATTLQTARTINGTSFNGSADITIPLLRSIDNRTTSPSIGNAGYMTFAFGSWANNNTADYSDNLIMRSYTDSSGGNDNMISFRKGAIGMRIWQQSFGSATAFSTFKDVAFTDSSITGNAATATTWQTARTLTIGNTGKSVDGSAAVSWSLAEIGALPLTGGTLTGSIKINTTGSSSTSSHLIIKRSGATEPGSFGGYSGSWRSGIEVWNNDSTRMLFLNPPESDSLYSNIKSVGGGFFIDVGSSGGTRAIQIESTGAANFPVGLAHNGNAVLTTGNYNSYALPLTGGTLSGNSYIDFGPNTTWSATLRVGGNGHGGGSRASVVTTNGNLHLDAGTGSAIYLNTYAGNSVYFGNGATSQVAQVASDGTFRSSVFYDFSDTAYYLDPNASTSIRTAGDWRADTSAWTGEFSGKIQYHSNSWYFQASNLFIWRNSSGTDVVYSNQSGELTAVTNVRSPLFYDSNNTAYYVDPASTSNLNYSVVRNLISGDGYRFTNPQGGSYVTGASSATGAIRIRLPANRRLANTMLQLKVKVYEYTTGCTHEFIISGYNYTYWVNVAATQTTDSGRGAFNVRWGDDGTYQCIWIGETGTVWSYPQVHITEVQLGYSGYSNEWGNGWSVDFVTSFNTVDTSRTASMVKTVNNAPNWVYPDYATVFYDSNDTNYYVDPANSTALFSNGVVVAGNQGFQSRFYATGRNRIWSFYNADSYGLSYFQGSGGYNSADSVGIHFGTASAAASQFTFATSPAGTFIANGGVRSPIFYDLDDTNYYVDAASSSGSRLSHLYVGNVAGSNDGGWNARLKVIGSSHARIDVVSNSDGIVTSMYSHTTQGVGRVGTTSNHPLILIAENGNDGGSVYNGSLRSPIFYDSNNTSYYIDAASTSVLNRISTVRADNWLYLDNNYGHSVVGVYDSYRLQGVFSMGDSYKLSADGTSAGNLYGLAWSHPNAGSLGGANNLNDHGLLIINNGSFRAALSSRAVFSADVRGTLFYDYNDTSYSLDPAGTSVLWRPSAATQQRWSISWRAMDASASRPQWNNDSDYWTTTVGWATNLGTWANYWKYGFGGFDCWGSSTDHPQGAGYVHAQGIQSGLHYANSDGSSAYGWQMVGASNATDNRYWARGKWGGSISSWKEFAMYGGGGAGDLRASLFYDSDNTGYYVDPASTSNLNVLAVQRAYAGYDAGVTNSFSCSAWFRSSGTTGWYNESYAGGINMEDTTWVRVYNSKGFYVNNQIAASGDVTSLYSDERLKIKLGNIPNALEAVCKLNGFRYINNEVAKSHGYNDDKVHLGVSAQEVEALFPEIVSLAPFDMHTDETSGEITSKSGNNYKTVAYDKLVPVLIEAVKDQQKIIDAQEERINRLEKLVEKLTQ